MSKYVHSFDAHLYKPHRAKWNPQIKVVVPAQSEFLDFDFVEYDKSNSGDASLTIKVTITYDDEYGGFSNSHDCILYFSDGLSPIPENIEFTSTVYNPETQEKFVIFRKWLGKHEPPTTSYDLDFDHNGNPIITKIFDPVEGMAFEALQNTMMDYHENRKKYWADVSKKYDYEFLSDES